MTSLIEWVGSRVDENCRARRMKKGGCGIGMADAPTSRLIVDCDKRGAPVAADAGRCDYLVVAEGESAPGWVAVIELKRGGLHANQVASQLRAGASVAEKLVPRDGELRFRPVVASGKTSKYELQKLKAKRNRIPFHGRCEPVRWVRCGDGLATAFRG